MKKLFILVPITLLVLMGAGCNNTNQVVQPEKQSQVDPEQVKCESEAKDYFNKDIYKNGNGFTFTYQSHFNPKLNTCFILITSSDSSDDSLFFDLYDAVSGKNYATYIGHSICNPQALASSGKSPTTCVLDTGDIWFDGNNTRMVSDYHVGYGGFKTSGGGDENTEKQFVDHVQQFINN